MSVIGNGSVQISGRDVASYFYNTRTGFAGFIGFAYWLFRWKVTVPEQQLVNMIWSHRDSYVIKAFLQIRMVTEAPEAVKVLPKQQYRYSCGASALRQAAFELGVSHIPRKEIYKFDGQGIEESSAEEAIYGISGGLLDNSRKQRAVKPERGRYSLPDGVVSAARELGLDGRLYCSSLRLRCYLKLRHSKEWARATACSPVSFWSSPKLCLNERRILAVMGKDASELHYIMQRPDGSCYDPKDAHEYKSLDSYKINSGRKPTGVSVLISNREVYPGVASQVANGMTSGFCPVPAGG